jgi:hypothetical protein
MKGLRRKINKQDSKKEDKKAKQRQNRINVEVMGRLTDE